jgi:hypothetical protein
VIPRRLAISKKAKWSAFYGGSVAVGTKDMGMSLYSKGGTNNFYDEDQYD